MGCSVCKFVPPSTGDSKKFISNKNNSLWVTPVTHTILSVPESPSSNFNFHHQAFSQNRRGKSVLLRSLTEANLELRPYKREENTSNQRLDGPPTLGVDRTLDKSFSTDLSSPSPEPAFATSTVIEKPKKTDVGWRPISFTDIADSNRSNNKNNSHTCIPTFCNLSSGPLVEAQMFVSRDEKGVARLVNRHVIHHPNSSKGSVQGEICIEITHKTPISGISTKKGASIAEGMPIYSSCLPNPQILDQLPRKYETSKNELIRDDIKPKRRKPKCSWKCARLSPHSPRPSKQHAHSKSCTRKQCCLMTPCCKTSSTDDKPYCKKKERKRTPSPRAKTFSLFRRCSRKRSPYSYSQLPNADNLRDKCHCVDGGLIDYLKQLENIVLTNQKNPNHISLSSTVEVLSVKRPPISSSSSPPPPPPPSTTGIRREITNYDSTDNIEQQEQRHNASIIPMTSPPGSREVNLTLNNQLIHHPNTNSTGEKSNSSDYLDEENSSQSNVYVEQINESLEIEQTKPAELTKLNSSQNDQNLGKGHIPQNSCHRYHHRYHHNSYFIYPHHLHPHYRDCYHNHSHQHQHHQRHNHSVHSPFNKPTNISLPMIDQKQKTVIKDSKLQTNNKRHTSLSLPRLNKSEHTENSKVSRQ